MRLHKTGHPIADTVSDLIGELPDGDYKAAYGILRHNEFKGSRRFFEVDKGFWGALHYNGNYRISFCGTQPTYHDNGPKEAHGLPLKVRLDNGNITLIAPPTSYVCDFFGIDYTSWLTNAIRQAYGPYVIRHKGDESPINWDDIKQLITFNSTLGVKALQEGVPVISDPVHSTIGSYLATVENYSFDAVNRDELFSFCMGHMFKLHEKEKICSLINHYLSQSSSGSTAEKP